MFHHLIKRAFDFFIALVGLVFLSPALTLCAFLIWLEDYHSPFYRAPRIGRGGSEFRMLKLRSMRVNSDRNGSSSTKVDDGRITKIGHLIRRFKLDEFLQLWNVLMGEMSLVGPRPQVRWAVDIYTEEERQLLSIRPGITDFASLVFADEGEILKGSKDPDGDYLQLIRPWKSKLGIFYVQSSTIWLDLKLVLLTIKALFSRENALRGVQALLKRLGADAELIRISGRRETLVPQIMGKISNTGQVR